MVITKPGARKQKAKLGKLALPVCRLCEGETPRRTLEIHLSSYHGRTKCVFKIVMLAGQALLHLIAAVYTCLCSVVKLQCSTWRPHWKFFHIIYKERH